MACTRVRQEDGTVCHGFPATLAVLTGRADRVDPGIEAVIIRDDLSVIGQLPHVVDAVKLAK